MVDWTNSKEFNTRSKDPRLSDFAEVVEFKKNKPRTLRLIGPANRVAIHWIEIRKKDGGKTRIPRLCLAYDGDKGEFNGECPYCSTLNSRPRVQVVTNVIDRDEQENPPRKLPQPTGKERKLVEHFGEEMYIKSDKDSPTWTPVRLASLSTSVASKISDLSELNKVKDKKGNRRKFGPDHPKHGFDLVIKYDPDREPANQYSVMKGDNTELTEEELAYLRWRLDLEKPKTLAEAKLDVKGLLKVLFETVSDDDEEDSPKKGKKSSKKQEFDDSDFDDDEDERPKGKKSSKKSRDDDDDDDDDEDDVPFSKSSKKSSRKALREDDDEDAVDDEEDDDRPKSKKSSRKSSRDADDEDEDERPKGKKSSKKPRDDEEDDEDEDEDEPPRSKKSSKKSRREEDDEDDDEPRSKKSTKKSRDDDDDDDDERPKSKKSSKKSRRDDDDEDDDDDDDWGDDD